MQENLEGLNSDMKSSYERSTSPGKKMSHNIEDHFLNKFFLGLKSMKICMGTNFDPLTKK